MTPRIQITSRGPLVVGSVVFRDNHGHLVCTIVAKMTYALAPGISAPLEEPLPIQEDDDHWDDDPARSVHVPSDLAPFKKAPEVVVVGSAFAPGDRPAASVVARVIVGAVDKSVEAHGPRFLLREGGMEEAPRARRFSLRHEVAGGGPETDNPMGIDISRADARGRRPVPQLLPVAFEIGPHTNHVPTVSLGPLPASFRLRSGQLSPADRAWLSAFDREPLPTAFPTNYFQSAPMDQWLVRPLAANERIVLENLHQRHPRLVMTLSGLEPQAVVVGHAEPVRLRGDLLVIDSDRALCTLTFRGHAPLGDLANAFCAVVTTVPVGTLLSAEQVKALAESVVGDEILDESEFEIADDAMELTRDISPEALAKIVPGAAPSALPFSGEPRAPAPVRPAKRTETITTFTNLRERRSTMTAPGTFKEETLPFAPPPVPAPVRQPSYPDGVLAPPSTPAPIAPPPMMTPARMFAPPPLPSAPPIPPPVPLSEPKPRAEIGSVPPVDPAKPVSLFKGLRARDSAPAAPKDNAPAPAPIVMSVQGASDAAAHEEKSRAAPNREMPSRSPGQPLRRLAVVDLLAFEPKIAPRLRNMKRLAPIWSALAKMKGPLHADDPQRTPPDPDRESVLRALSCAEGQTPVEIRRALAESLEDLSDLDPPLVLCTGELVPRFDDLEMLRASVAIAASVAGTDKRLLGSLAVAQEALSATHPPAPETLRNLAKQIETASSTLPLPPKFIALNVERVLVENRSYKRRPILGASRVRADLVLGGGEVFPLYLPDDTAKSLPLLPSFPVVAICEVRPREDLMETQSEALLCVALGRVLHVRSG